VVLGLLLLVTLVLLNGALSMSEIALVSAKRSRLQALADDGHRGAARALELSAHPSRYLSTVQVGITSIGILSGAIGEATLVRHLESALATLPVVQPYAGSVALAMMVIIVTALSVILGELAPKRIGLLHPELVARWAAPLLHRLSVAAQPVVRALIITTDALLSVLRIERSPGPAVTADDVRGLIEQGMAEGVFQPAQRELLTNVLDLNRPVAVVMTPRAEVVYLDVSDSAEQMRQRLADSWHGMLPVCEGGIQHVVGVVRTALVMDRLLKGQAIPLRALMSAPVLLPEAMSLVRALERLRLARSPMGLVINEHGDVEGLVSVSDIVGAVVGGLPSEPDEEPPIVRRADGTLLIDGRVSVDALERELGLSSLDGEDSTVFHTVGGLVAARLGRVPRTGDAFEVANVRFEVVDMDFHRVDRVLVSRLDGSDAASAPAGE
jgi:putative hemolysin